jgi:hypothetical protein
MTLLTEQHRHLVDVEFRDVGAPRRLIINMGYFAAPVPSGPVSGRSRSSTVMAMASGFQLPAPGQDFEKLQVCWI